HGGARLRAPARARAAAAPVSRLDRAPPRVYLICLMLHFATRRCRELGKPLLPGGEKVGMRGFLTLDELEPPLPNPLPSELGFIRVRRFKSVAEVGYIRLRRGEREFTVRVARSSITATFQRCPA